MDSKCSDDFRTQSESPIQFLKSQNKTIKWSTNKPNNGFNAKTHMREKISKFECNALAPNVASENKVSLHARKGVKCPVLLKFLYVTISHKMKVIKASTLSVYNHEACFQQLLS